MKPTRFVWCALVALAACVVADLDYVGKQCTTTCPDGLSCVSGVCQLAADASTDGSSADASPAQCDARFCDDFERTSPLGAWDTMNVSDDGVLAIALDGDAGNHVLRASIVDGSATTTPLAYLSKQLGDAAVDTVTYSFRMYATGVAWSSVALVGINLTQPDNSTASIAIELLYPDDGGGRIGAAMYHSQQGDASSQGATQAMPIPLGQWTNVTLFADFSARKVKITVGGTIALDTALFASAPNYTPGIVSVNAGLTYTTLGLVNNDAFDMRIDDVAVSYTP
jgi:hypothetical protein